MEEDGDGPPDLDTLFALAEAAIAWAKEPTDSPFIHDFEEELLIASIPFHDPDALPDLITYIRKVEAARDELEKAITSPQTPLECRHEEGWVADSNDFTWCRTCGRWQDDVMREAALDAAPTQDQSDSYPNETQADITDYEAARIERHSRVPGFPRDSHPSMEGQTNAKIS
jgi:hypothetical protein